MAPTISPKAVLIDLAGVLHTGDDPLPGAVRALERLRASGLSLRFLTNTTRTPSTILFAKLQRMGFTLAASEIQTAALAAAKVPVIAYVSCNPITFARDAKTLLRGGYSLDWVQVVDQFRWSAHIELSARFSRT